MIQKLALALSFLALAAPTPAVKTMANPMVAPGDIVIGGANGAPLRLGPGAEGQVLRMAQGKPFWATPPWATNSAPPPPPPGPVITTPPAASSITTTGATFTWGTTTASSSQVFCGTTTSYGLSTTLDTSLVTSHSQAITGLSANTLYHFKAQSIDAASNSVFSNDYTFTTAQAGSTITSVSVSPSTLSINVGATQTFTPTVSGTGSYSSAVNWTAARGSFVGAVYTAPATSGSDTVTATSAQDGTKTGTCAVTVNAVGPIITNVAASSITTTGFTISWNLNKYGTGQTHYRIGSGAWSTSNPENSLSYNAHAQVLSGLTPGTTYTVYVVSCDGASFTGNCSDTSGTPISVTTTSSGSDAATVNAVPTFSGITSTGFGVIGHITDSDGVRNQTDYVYSDSGGTTLLDSNTTGTFSGRVSSTTFYTKTTAETLNGLTGVWTLYTSGLASVTTSSGVTGTSVKSSPYNAYGDGSHDDTAAIQACVNAVAGTGGTVYVPSGTYMVNTYAGSTAGNGIELGSNMTFYLASGATLQAISTTTGHARGNVLWAVGVSNLTISGPGTVRGERTSHGGTTNQGFMGLYITGSSVTVSGPTFSYHNSDGIYVGGGSNSNITIAGVTCDNNNRQGMSITNVTTMLVTGSTFSNSGHGQDPGAGIDIEPNGGNLCSGVHITGNCVFANNAGGGLHMGPQYSDKDTSFVTGCLIENNEFYGNGSGSGPYYDVGGIRFASCIAGHINTIQNNNFHNNLGSGIKMLYSNGHVITGNQITYTTGSGGGTSGDTGTGIYTENCSGNTITGNTITNNAGGGVWIQDHLSNTITPNTFSGNGGANYP